MKIKKVNIVGFRSYAYDGDGLFDFTGPDGEISNFVTIYGPNGFGKSSIYDAIEWSITNTISRYNRDSQRINNNETSLALNQKGFSQNILRNRYIEDTDPSFVEVETSTHGPFHRPLKKAKLGTRDYKFDPKDADAETKHLSDIFLSQDAIDSFLKEERAEGRYEKFMARFGGQDEIYRQKLYFIRRTSQNEREKLSSQIEALRSSLVEAVETEAITHLSHTLGRLNQYGVKFEEVSPNFSAAQHLESKNKVLLCRETYTTNLKSIESRVALIGIASSKLPEYSEACNQLNLLKSDRTNTAKQREIIVNINNIQSEVESLENARNPALTVLNERKKQQEYLPNFLEKRKLADSALLVSEQFQEKKNKFLSDLAGINSRKDSKAIELSDLQQRLAKEKISRDEIPGTFVKLEQTRNELKDLAARKIEFVNNGQELLKQKDFAINARNNLQRLTIDMSISAESIVAATDSTEISSKFLAIKAERERALEQVKVHKDLLSQLAIRDQNISEIVRMSSEVLAHTRSDTCPLCSHRYNSHEELVSKIFSNDGISPEQSSILFLVENDEKTILELEKTLHDLLQKISTLKKERITYQNEAIEKVVKLIEENNDAIKRITAQIEKIGEDESKLSEATGNLSKIQFQDTVDATIEYIESDIEKISSELKAFEAEAADLKKSVTELESQIAQEKENVKNILQDTAYTALSSYLANYEVAAGQEQAFFDQQLNEAQIKLSSLNLRIKDNLEQATLARASLSEFDFPSDLSLLDKKIDSLNEKIRVANESIKIIIDSLISAGAAIGEDKKLGPKDLSDVLDELRRKCTQESQAYTEILGILDLLDGQLDLALKLADSSRLIERIRLLESQVLAHVKLENDLDHEYAEVEKSLKQRINEFFYEDLINNIYSKIDPHPSFKTIDFTSVFPENGDKPRLEIYLREEGGKPISPNFYFSAAQLNVLSLSIFLARALHVKHKGEPVQTILIDDPIQSMDSINILSTIDLLRGISQKFNRQIILSTHDENFFELLKMKVPESKFNSKFIKLAEYGKVAL